MSRRVLLHPFFAPEEKPAGRRPGEVAFDAHLDLLRFFLTRRDEIVDAIQALLNAQRTPDEYLQDAALLARRFEDCFFALPGVTESQFRLRGQLEEAHWAGGFKPRQIPGLHNGPAEPAELMLRAFFMWRQTRWPGRNGRVRYAHTLFNLYLIRCLELLTMRVWDAGASAAGTRLAQVQRVLDTLWSVNTPDQPALVRDARWLVQTAQSLATDDLGAYFDVAERIARDLPEDDRIEIHKAGARMAGGHLRSQIRHYSTTRVLSFDDHRLIVNTRTTNALDFALLVQDLVPLLEAYEQASRRDDSRTRIELADVICQGISPDPELFLNRVELLAAYSMLEHLFMTTRPDGHVVRSPMGQRHARLLDQYEVRIGRVSRSLAEDCRRFRPVAGAYSPYGVLYGFSADLVKHMALKASQPDAESRFGLEDVFVAGDVDSGKLAWVGGWRKLPHLTRDTEKLFDYPQQFAEDVFDRIDRELRRRAADDDAGRVVRTGRLFVSAADRPPVDSNVSPIPDLPVRYLASSDEQLVAAHKAEPCDETQILRDRREGKFLLSCKTTGGWLAISKAVLTDVLADGRDVKIAGLPAAAVETLQVMYPRLVV